MTKTLKILLVVFLVVVVGAAGYWNYYMRDKETSSKQQAVKNAEFPIFTIYRDGKIKFLVHSTKDNKNYELFSLAYPDQDRLYLFSADYSKKHKTIVYSDLEGIKTYDLESGKTNTILSNNTKSTDEDAPSIFSHPRFSKDENKISLRASMSDSPGAYLYFIDPNGENLTKTNMYGYSIVWANKENKYATPTGIQDVSPIVKVSLDNDISKTRDIKFDGKGILDLVFDKNDQYFILSGYDLNKKDDQGYDRTGNLYMADTSNGGNIKTLVDDEFDNYNPVIDTNRNNIYFGKKALSKSSNYGVPVQAEGKGIYLTTLTQDKPELFYQDGDNLLNPLSISENNLIFTSRKYENYSSDVIENMYMINLTSKKVDLIGESSSFNFVGWIGSDKIKNAKEFGEIKATDVEKDAFSNALKTKGYLSQTYYDYCWDYNCQSKTYPYAKLTSSKKPEIINLQQKPYSLSGKIDIPLVFMYEDKSFSDEQKNMFLDKDIKNSYTYFINLMNQKLKNADIDASLNLKTVEEQIKAETKCVTTEGTVKKLNNDCVVETIKKKYSAFESAPFVFIVYIKSGDGYYNNYNDYYSVKEGDNYSRSIQLFYHFVYESTMGEDQGYSFKQNVEYTNYNIKQIMSDFGAKSKQAMWKSREESSKSACYIENYEDIMCGAYWPDDGSNVDSLDLSQLSIGSITKKELGWYDADGDGTNEVSDKCPFNSKNDC